MKHRAANAMNTELNLPRKEHHTITELAVQFEVQTQK